MIPLRSFPKTVKAVVKCEKLYRALVLFIEVVEMNEKTAFPTQNYQKMFTDILHLRL